ncbi:MAG: GNAT family N-acetyltransferase [Nocardioidaceae bacterium]
MKSHAEIWPLFGLRVTCGELELTAIRDDDIPSMVALVESGIHDPDAMPFAYPWTEAPDLVRNTARYYWRTRAEFEPAKWTLDFAVRRNGELVGTQGFATVDYAVTRTGETGSWLARRFQEHGIGTAMRRVACAFLFDHLGAAEITSAAWVDNPASLAVSRKVGYVDNGRFREKRRVGEATISCKLLLTPETFIRPREQVVVEGLAPVREWLGLEQLDEPGPS